MGKRTREGELWSSRDRSTPPRFVTKVCPQTIYYVSQTGGASHSDRRVFENWIKIHQCRVVRTVNNWADFLPWK